MCVSEHLIKRAADNGRAILEILNQCRAIYYALFLPNLRGSRRVLPQHSVLATKAGRAVIETLEGGNLSSQELQEKFTAAVGKMGRAKASDGAKRHKPIYERNSQRSERQAIAEAANALTALWKVRRAEKA